MVKWHDDDKFWEKMIPVLFPLARIEASSSEIDAVLCLAGIQNGAVLDMGCGVGRHSIELARRGFHVTGVDRTQVYLSKATNQADGQGLDIKFIKADMREFQRDEEFDGALSLFTTFGYFVHPKILCLKNYRKMQNCSDMFHC